MAAKQGLTAQLSQASEDAKRAVLSRTGVTASSWFANLNTVCTIKSAPPKSPEVLQMLATKSGWLFKRNEQHVWQPRWCCVVPHMFLYYFDASAATPSQSQNLSLQTNGGNGSVSLSNGQNSMSLLSNPTLQQQEDWNAAISRGYGNRKQHERRSNFYLFGGATSAVLEHENDDDDDIGRQSSSRRSGVSSAPDSAASSSPDSPVPPHPAQPPFDDSYPPTQFPSGGPVTSSMLAHAQPAGIIDLECYTNIHRSSHNHLILELAGDDQVNPDLRAFYFSARSASDADDWTDALLNDRHAALVDECDAYKQVCDGFAQQLQELHAELDASMSAQEQAREEVYRVRCQSEELRRSVCKILQDCLDCAGQRVLSSKEGNNLTGTNTENSGATNSKSTSGVLTIDAVDDAIARWERIRRQDMGVQPAVQVVCDLALRLLEQLITVSQQYEDLQFQLQQSGMTDNRKVKELQDENAQLLATQAAERENLKSQLEALKSLHNLSQKELQDVQKELHSTRTEMAMMQTQQKNKTATLQEHKKILKKEVIDLRSKLEDALSEQNTLKHQQSTHVLMAEQERQKNQLLERYVEKIESQVKVQQNIMEMMSQSGVGSVYGGSIANGNLSGRGIMTGVVGTSGNGIDDGVIDKNCAGGGSSYAPCAGPPQDVAVVRSVHGKLSSDGNSVSGDIASNISGNGANASMRSRTFVMVHNNRASGANVKTTDVDEGDDDGDDVVVDRLAPLLRGSMTVGNRRSLMVDDDNKSHMSELTEDRTQRHFDTYRDSFNHPQYVQNHPDSQLITSTDISPRMALVNRKLVPDITSLCTPEKTGPPSFIIGNSAISNEDLHNESENQPQTLETIHGSAVNLIPGQFSTPKHSRKSSNDVPRNPDSSSICSDALQRTSRHQLPRLSVAQRARMEADRHSTPVRVRVDSKQDHINSEESKHQSPSFTSESSQNQSTNNSQSSGLWRRMEEAVLGPRVTDPFSDDGSASSFRSTRITDYTDVDTEGSQRRSSSRRSSPKRSELSLTLQERCALQRAKQLQFLKQQGLLKDDDVKGGAATSPSLTTESGSITSTSMHNSHTYYRGP